VPQSIIKPIDMSLVAIAEADYVTVPLDDGTLEAEVPAEQLEAFLAELEGKMREAARRFDFKQAAAYRDRLNELKTRLVLDSGSGSSEPGTGIPDASSSSG
jgi:excinuclease ABC subunit B